LDNLALVLSLLIGASAHAGTVKFSGPVSKCSMHKLVNGVAALSAAGDRDITVKIGSSDGGDLYAALKAMTELRRYNVNTHATGECASACTVVYAAGAQRSAKNAKFMFHGTQVATHKLKVTTVAAISADPCAPAAVKITKGEALTKAEQNEFRHHFADSWLIAIRQASPSLANELDRRDVLLNEDEKWYSTKAARAHGYVNN
jgi:hypothetical protein